MIKKKKKKIVYNHNRKNKYDKTFFFSRSKRDPQDENENKVKS